MDKHTNARMLMIQMNQRPIAYYPIYRDLTGATTAGILLSQLLFWHSQMNGAKFYKTDAEIISETHLTENELRGAKDRLKDLPFVLITKEGLPCKTFYDFDLERLALSIMEFGEQESLSGTNKFSEIHETGTKENHETSFVKSTKLTLLHRTQTKNTSESKADCKPDGLFSDGDEPKKSKGGSKWGDGVFEEAKRIFDENYRAFNKKNGLHVGEMEGVYWSVKEIGQMSKFMQMLKAKAEANGNTYKSSMDFVTQSLSVFLEKSANLTNAWYMGKFTPTNFVTHFEDIYIDVKKNISSGYIGRQKKTSEQLAMTNMIGLQQTMASMSHLYDENGQRIGGYCD